MKLYLQGERVGNKQPDLEFSLRREPYDSSQIQLMVKVVGEPDSKREHLLTIDENGVAKLSTGISPSFGLRLVGNGKLDIA